MQFAHSNQIGDDDKLLWDSFIVIARENDLSKFIIILIIDYYRWYNNSKTEKLCSFVPI